MLLETSALGLAGREGFEPPAHGCCGRPARWVVPGGRASIPRPMDAAGAQRSGFCRAGGIRTPGPWMLLETSALGFAGREGFEPPATGFGDQRSDQTELPP